MRGPLVLSALAIVASLARPAAADDQAACAARPEPAEPVIGACSRLIEAGALSDRNRAVAHESRGSAHRARQENREAIRDFDAAIRLNPGFALAYASRGDAYAATLESPIMDAIQNGLRGRSPSAATYDQALEDFTQAIALDPALAQAYYHRAYLHRYRERYASAIEDYGKAIALNRADSEAGRRAIWAATVNRGTAHGALRQFDVAIRDFDAALALNPRSVFTLNERAIAFAKTGRYDRAIEDFEAALRIDPRHEQAHGGRLRAVFLQEHVKAALRDLDSAIERDPSEARAYVLRAAIGAGGPARSLADLDRALALDPTLAVAYLERGSVYARNGERSRAIADFTSAIAHDTRSVAAYAARGEAHAQAGETEKAEADFRRALLLNPANERASLGLHRLGARGPAGEAEHDCRHDPDSGRRIAACTAVIAADPQNIGAHLARAQAWRTKGQIDRAMDDFGKAIEIDPNGAEALNDRGVAHNVNREQPARAIEDYDRAIALDPRQASAYNNRGLAYGALGQYDRALADFEQAIAIDPRFALAYANRGLAYKSKGMVAEALASFRLAVALDPASSLARERLERLAAR